MDVCVEGGEEELGDEADGGGGRVELVEEALVPGVDAVVEDLGDGGEEAFLACALGGGEEVGEVCVEGGRGQEVALYESVGRRAPGTSGCADGGVVIGALDERDDEGLDGIDELGRF